MLNFIQKEPIRWTDVFTAYKCIELKSLQIILVLFDYLNSILSKLTSPNTIPMNWNPCTKILCGKSFILIYYIHTYNLHRKSILMRLKFWSGALPLPHCFIYIFNENACKYNFRVMLKISCELFWYIPIHIWWDKAG